MFFLFFKQSYWISDSELSERINIDEVLPSNCGQRAKDFNDDDDLIFQKVVHGSVAPKGTYPWQVILFFIKFLFFFLLNTIMKLKKNCDIYNLGQYSGTRTQSIESLVRRSYHIALTRANGSALFGRLQQRHLLRSRWRLQHRCE